MKKILFILMMLMPMVAGAKDYELYCSINDVSTGGPFFEDSNVRFEFGYIRFSDFLKVRVTNKTDSRIAIEWENARISDRQISFDSDNIFSYNNQKPDEIVHSNSTTTKSIGERNSPDMRLPIFLASSIKERGKSVVEVIIPIKFASGNIKDYKVFVCLKAK